MLIYSLSARFGLVPPTRAKGDLTILVFTTVHLTREYQNNGCAETQNQLKCFCLRQTIWDDWNRVHKNDHTVEILEDICNKPS